MAEIANKKSVPLLRYIILFVTVIFLNVGMNIGISVSLHEARQKTKMEITRLENQIYAIEQNMSLVIDKVQTMENAGKAPPQFAEAHKHHGILGSFWDPVEHDWFFYRDGKKCRLFGWR